MTKRLISIISILCVVGGLGCTALAPAGEAGDDGNPIGGKADCVNDGYCDEIELPTEDEDLVVPGQRDTGYFSSAGAEIVGSFNSRAVVSYPDLSDTELEAMAERLRETTGYNYELSQITNGQLEMAKNQLNAEELHINLSSSDINSIEVAVDLATKTLTIDYSITAESVVAYADVDAADLANLLGSATEIAMIADPRTPVTRLAAIGAADPATSVDCQAKLAAYADYGFSDDDFTNCLEPLVAQCASGYDDQVRNYNFFYYFDPSIDLNSDGNSDCRLGELVTATFVADDLMEEKTVFPEYDRLLSAWSTTYNFRQADGTLTELTYDEDANVLSTVMFFGAAKHTDEVEYYDWGAINWRRFNYTMQERGFTDRGVYAQEYQLQDDATATDPTAYELTNIGRRWERTLDASGNGCIEGTDGCIKVIVDVISPYDLHDLKKYSAERDADGLFHQALRTHDLLIYGGHSFYGSLDVLDHQENYTKDVYQVVFMSSCWSYEYYTKNVLEMKASERDALGCDAEHGCEGWADVDVINDTESGWFHNNPGLMRIIITNLMYGAVNGGAAVDDRVYSWNNIITQMNDYALEQQAAHGSATVEIFGVSGARTNQFCPENMSCAGDDGGDDHSGGGPTPQ